jgi:hypothetical protein
MAAILKKRDNFLLYSLGYLWHYLRHLVEDLGKKSSEASQTPSIIRKSVLATSPL